MRVGEHCIFSEHYVMIPLHRRVAGLDLHGEKTANSHERSRVVQGLPAEAIRGVAAEETKEIHRRLAVMIDGELSAVMAAGLSGLMQQDY